MEKNGIGFIVNNIVICDTSINCVIVQLMTH